MKILAFIPARGGSKRLPGKNVKKLGGVPLIAWSIEGVCEMPEICDVLVSTDNEMIAKVAEQYGALVPWLRPPELATDESHVVDTALHALDWYEAKHGACDGLLLIQPTSPFRTRKTISDGIQVFRAYNKKTVIGVSKVHVHPSWSMRIEDSGCLKPFMGTHGLNCRSQDLTPAYVVNGSFYLIAPSILRSERSFFPQDMFPLIINSQREALDIDTQWDWDLAEYFLEKDRQEVSTV